MYKGGRKECQSSLFPYRMHLNTLINIPFHLKFRQRELEAIMLSLGISSFLVAAYLLSALLHDRTQAEYNVSLVSPMPFPLEDSSHLAINSGHSSIKAIL